MSESIWSFESALDETIKGKYGLYVNIIELEYYPWIKEKNMKNYWLDKKEGVSMETCRQVAARIWCDKDFSSVTMDAKICDKIAHLLFEAANHYPLVKEDSSITEEYYHG